MAIGQYIEHRTSREADIERAVRAAPAAGVLVDELVRRLYRDKPIMSAELFAAGSDTVHCHLVRLAASGRAGKNERARDGACRRYYGTFCFLTLWARLTMALFHPDVGVFDAEVHV